MTEKFLLLDCDGVLLDWVGGFRRFLNERCGIFPGAEDPEEYDLTKWIGVRERSEMIDLVHRFNLDDGGYFSQLPPLPGAVEALSELRREGFEPHIITACSTNEIAIQAREKNLQNVFAEIGGFESVTYVDIHESKWDALIGFPPSIFIEDNVENALIGAAAQHETYLMHASHNAQAPLPQNVLRVMNWKNCLETLLDAQAPHFEYL